MLGNPAGHTAGTFRGNQLAMGTGLATINTIKEQNLAQNAQQRGDFLQAELKKLAQEFPCIGNVRGRGLMIGIEIVDERKQSGSYGFSSCGFTVGCCNSNGMF